MAVKDFRRFADLGVIASVQPYHAIDDGRWAEGRIGPARAKMTYYAAVPRATLDGRRPGGWVPEQKVSHGSFTRPQALPSE